MLPCGFFKQTINWDASLEIQRNKNMKLKIITWKLEKKMDVTQRFFCTKLLIMTSLDKWVVLPCPSAGSKLHQ